MGTTAAWECRADGSAERPASGRGPSAPDAAAQRASHQPHQDRGRSGADPADPLAQACAEIGTPYDIVRPGRQTVPFVFASPHSGRRYPSGLIAASKLDPVTLRRSEDAFVDALFDHVPSQGAPLLQAHFPRAFVDVNREPWELDQSMFADRLPAWCNSRSLKVASGLGTIARVVSDGAEIYRRPLRFSDAQTRIASLYEPYHKALGGLLDQTHQTFGCAVLIDCHSMPSIGGPLDRDRGTNRSDMVIGDRYGTACAPVLTRLVASVLRDMGFRVARNSPYAGGHCTAHYGAPGKGRHALQIEVNRCLYMDERRMVPLPAFDDLKAALARLTARLTALRIDQLLPH